MDCTAHTTNYRSLRRVGRYSAMPWSSFFLVLAVPISVSSVVQVLRPKPRCEQVCFAGSCGSARSVSGRSTERPALTRPQNRWTSGQASPTALSMGFGGGSTNRYSWEETDKELNVKARMPAWAKGKSIALDMTKTHIRLVLKEEADKPIIEGELRGAITIDGSYWTMETLDDLGKMLYLTLEKAPQLTGLGPWMGVVVGEEQVDSDYPEDQKAEGIAAAAQEQEIKESGSDSGGPPRHTGIVDEDGFCRDLMAVQAISGAMIARQVPVNGNALFSSVAASLRYLDSGEHPVMSSPEIESEAKELRQRTMDHLTRAYKEGDKFYLQGDTIPARQFIAAQARANNMIDGDEYLKAMRDDTMWGGGAEVVGLTHVLERPIYVYELQSTGRRFGLRQIGMFGAPRFSEAKPVHVLNAYARFPDLDPGTQSAEGNHYLALYPYEDVPEKNKEKI